MNTFQLSQIERGSLYDRAYIELRDALLGGRFEPGQKITLRALASALGISLTPVRDAVNRLVAERVVEQGPNGSAIVPYMTTEAFKDIVEVRCLLEGTAASDAARNASEEDADRIADLLLKLTALLEKRKFHEYLLAHREFHFEIYRASRRHILLETIERLWLRSGPSLNFVVPDYVLRKKGADFHRAAVNAIRARKPTAARDAIISDIRSAGAFVLDLADDDGIIRKPSASKTAAR